MYLKSQSCLHVFSPNFQNIFTGNEFLQYCNHFHNSLRLFDVLPNFPFTTSETMDDYYLSTWYIRVPSRVAERAKT